MTIGAKKTGEIKVGTKSWGDENWYKKLHVGGESWYKKLGR